MVLPLVLLFFVIGLFPNLFFDKINPSVEALVDSSQPGAAYSAGRAPSSLLAVDKSSLLPRLLRGRVTWILNYLMPCCRN